MFAPKAVLSVFLTFCLAAIVRAQSPFYLASNGVTVLCPSAPNGSKGIVNGVEYTKRNVDQIRALIRTNDYLPLETTCTSGITSMSRLFKDKKMFNADIRSWDVSQVKSMVDMFRGALAFNQPIGSWDTRSLMYMRNIFNRAVSFNQPLRDWNTRSVVDFTGVFANAKRFNQDISTWDTGRATKMDYMFKGASAFNYGLSSWNVSRAKTMRSMFNKASSFNSGISSWDVRSVTDMTKMFSRASRFNQDLGRWTGKVNASPFTTKCASFSKGSSLSSAKVPKFNQKSVQDHEREKTEQAWKQYRGSFTVVLTKGYLQAVDNLRQRMMIMEYETNLQHIARRNAIARFVQFCAITKEPSIDFATTEALFENPRDLTVIKDEHLRMRCQSLIRTEEMKMKEKCFLSCTEEARRLAGVFSKTDFLAKVLPDPIEHGLVSSVETLMSWYQATKKE